MIKADGVKRFTLPWEFLRVHDGGWEWDLDDSGDRAVLTDAATGSETLFTGLACAWDADGGISTYEVYADGTCVGQRVDFYRGGGVRSIAGPDGTEYSFYESGALRKVRHRCGGAVGACRSFAEDGRVVENQVGSFGANLSQYLSMGARRFTSAARAKESVLPEEYVVAHGQDIGSLDTPTGREWTGLMFARLGDGSMAGYEFWVGGAVVGQWVRFFPGGTVQQLGSAMGQMDGTCWEFDPSGAPRRVSSWCMGKPVAVRNLDNDENVTGQQGAKEWDTYLDWAVRG